VVPLRPLSWLAASWSGHARGVALWATGNSDGARQAWHCLAWPLAVALVRFDFLNSQPTRRRSRTSSCGTGDAIAELSWLVLFALGLSS